MELLGVVLGRPGRFLEASSRKSGSDRQKLSQRYAKEARKHQKNDGNTRPKIPNRATQNDSTHTYVYYLGSSFPIAQDFCCTGLSGRNSLVSNSAPSYRTFLCNAPTTHINCLSAISARNFPRNTVTEGWQDRCDRVFFWGVGRCSATLPCDISKIAGICCDTVCRTLCSATRVTAMV